MAFSPEIQASIIKVAGEWALGMASSPDYNSKTGKTIPIQPSQMSGELEKNFDFAYKFLVGYLS